MNYYKPLVRLATLTGLDVILLVVTNLSFQADSRILLCREEKLQQDDLQPLSFAQDSLAGSQQSHFCIRDLQYDSARSLFCNLAGVFVTEMIVIYLLHRWGISPDGKRMLIYLWPYFLIAKYVVTLID